MSDPIVPVAGPRIWAAVPFKGPVGSKRRLSGLLDEDERARLSLAMLQDVLGALLAAPGIERVLLVTRRVGREWLPESPRLTIVDEVVDERVPDGRDTLNHPVRQAQAIAAENGVDALLIVPADLPLLAASDLGALFDAAEAASVVIAPDHARNGTNALLLRPSSAIEPGFGEGSFARHRRLAHAAGLICAVVERAGLGLDIDVPADIALLLATGQPCRAAGLLRELGVERRLVQRGLSSLAVRRQESPTP